MRLTRRAALFGLAASIAIGTGAASAQAPPPPIGAPPAPSPFARPGSSPPAPAPGGLVGYILSEQARFYRQMSGLVRGAAAGAPGAFWGLVGLSFLYGVFHAAGPGHGKAVISSYIVATGETIRRGIALSAASALVQALMAILMVLALSLALNATARTVSGALRWVELAAYGLVAIIGARLLWTKGRAFLVRVKAYRAGRPVAGLACDDNCVHLPPADQIARKADWRATLGVILAIGLRPCTGAVLILVFALAQNALSLGVAATLAMAAGTALTVSALAILAAGAKGLAARLASARPGPITLALSAAEVVAALVVLIFGAALFAGYLTIERMGPF